MLVMPYALEEVCTIIRGVKGIAWSKIVIKGNVIGNGATDAKYCPSPGQRWGHVQQVGFTTSLRVETTA